MKFNLKNRPNLQDVLSRGDNLWLVAFEKWFEGFEKELRERLIKNSSAFGKWDRPKELIEEILGE